MQQTTEAIEVPSMRMLALADGLYEYFCRAPSDINEHLPTLRRYAERCRTLTEMGVRRGVSTAALIAARPRSLVSYDLDGRFFRRHRERLYQQAAAQLAVSFRYVDADVLTVDIEPTDLLFIDTWHVYEQLRRELSRHAPHTERYILLHDTETFGELGEDPIGVRWAWSFNETVRRYAGVRPLGSIARRAGLRPAVVEFLAEHPEWRVAEHFENNNGLTVLARRR